jgi:hypothetical protein
MTSAIKRSIAREWLIFLACLVIGLSATYFTLYFNERVQMGFKTELNDEAGMPIPDWARPAYPVYKSKNPGDLFNDLWPILQTQYWGGKPSAPTHRSYDWNETAVKLWLCILSPYFAHLFLRSIIWSVNALRRPKQSSP